MLPHLRSFPQPREDQVSPCLSLRLGHTQDARDLATSSRPPPLTVTRGPTCLQVSLTEAEIEPLIHAICLQIKKTSPEPSNPATSMGWGYFTHTCRKCFKIHCLYWNGWGPSPSSSAAKRRDGHLTTAQVLLGGGWRGHCIGDQQRELKRSEHPSSPGWGIQVNTGPCYSPGLPAWALHQPLAFCQPWAHILV